MTSTSSAQIKIPTAAVLTMRGIRARSSRFFRFFRWLSDTLLIIGSQIFYNKLQARVSLPRIGFGGIGYFDA